MEGRRPRRPHPARHLARVAAAQPGHARRCGLLPGHGCYDGRSVARADGVPAPPDRRHERREVLCRDRASAHRTGQVRDHPRLHLSGCGRQGHGRGAYSDRPQCRVPDARDGSERRSGGLCRGPRNARLGPRPGRQKQPRRSRRCLAPRRGPSLSAGTPNAAGEAGDPVTAADQLQEILRSPGVPPLAFALAFAAGAGHAVTPGHGKSLAAAYLAGSRARLRDAAWLGGSVAVMHTLSVLVIGLAWTFLSLSDVLPMHRLTSWLQLLAGVLVVGTGVWLLRRRFHRHGHPHDHDHSHQHDKRPGLVLLGVSGGLTPSPAAFLVLVTGLFLGRTGFALLLVMTFGLGMAVVLFGVGALAVAGSSIVVRGARSRSLLRLATRVAPILAATGITVLGVAITVLAAVNLTTVT
ncbi:MAG: hypothetical protein HOU81_25060 [Hamadaea sp.]|nr:hypothetical protein [Hamadaea sp.]NUT20237.1 hypothetical protein [Hamadaea sp.]